MRAKENLTDFYGAASMSTSPTSVQPLATPSASVVIPAHNEQAVIGRCLAAMLAGAAPGELEVIVVCNGCTDQTAQIARSFGPDVVVIESNIPSKVAALNTGDRAARSFPRFYVDADIVLPLESLRRVAAVLRQGRCLAAAPRMSVDLTDCSAGVRAFYSVWMNHPYFVSGMIGSGVYALTSQGRARFQEFPNITADDAFVRRLFGNHERLTVSSAVFTVRAPRTLRSLLKIKTRSRRGNMELARRFPAMSCQSHGGFAAFAAALLKRPLLWPALLVYALVQVTTLVRAKMTLKKSGPALWERDESTRSLPSTQA